MSISVLIQVHNEERHLPDCIKSAKLLTDSIVITDMESTDKSVSIAEKHGADIHHFSPHTHYVEPARAFGIQNVKTDWVMILDADERMTKELAHEITKAISSTECTHYKIPRKNMFGGKKWLTYGGWWPDEQIRLIHIPSFKSWPTNIHSTPHINGTLGYLKQPFLHHFHGDLSQMVEKTVLFEDIESKLLFAAKKQSGIPIFFRKFFGELYRRLIAKQGFKDGEIGIIESIYQAFSKTITYLFLYEKNKKSSTL